MSPDFGPLLQETMDLGKAVHGRPYDLVEVLRLWSQNANDQGSQLAVEGLQAAADEIERLREERDYARRWVCQLLANPSKSEGLAFPGLGRPRDFAAEQGWDCFKEKDDGK